MEFAIVEEPVYCWFCGSEVEPLIFKGDIASGYSCSVCNIAMVTSE